jgi:hypothetical protein
VHPWKLFVGFPTAARVLWRDKLGQISLAVTTLFWGAGATLQFIVLKWAEQVLGLDLVPGRDPAGGGRSRNRGRCGLRGVADRR